ncbi:hypothetical protein BaRGS_00032598, partial [Batillaria attramentaria]
EGVRKRELYIRYYNVYINVCMQNCTVGAAYTNSVPFADRGKRHRQCCGRLGLHTQCEYRQVVKAVNAVEWQLMRT